MAVDRKFAYILFVYILLWFLGLLRMPFDHLFVAPWALLGLLLGSLGQPLAHFVTLWDAMDVALVCLGKFSSVLTKLDVQFRANGSQVRSLRRENDLADFSRGSRGSAVSPQSGARAAAPNPTSLAPGARMTVVKHTPSN